MQPSAWRRHNQQASPLALPPHRLVAALARHVCAHRLGGSVPLQMRLELEKERVATAVRRGLGAQGLRFKQNQATRQNQAAVRCCGWPVALSCMLAVTHLVVQSAAERPGGPLHVVHAGADQSHGADEGHDLGEACQLQE